MIETLHMEKRSMPVCLTPDQIKKIENFGKRKGALNTSQALEKMLDEA